MWPSQRLASINLDSQQRKSQARRRDRRGIRPIVTLLEERTLLSTVPITVTSLADSGNGTLRAAITTANAGSTSNQYAIGFSSGLWGTINLTEALPNLANNISITGPSTPTSLTVNRVSTAANFSVFTINIGDTVSISNITVADGNGTNSGGVSNNGTTAISNDIFTANNNSAIYNNGSLTVAGSTFASNSAGINGGGGIDNNAGSSLVTNSVFTNDISNL